MAKFILNRPDDSLSLSRGKIVLTAIKWLVILVVGTIVLRIACLAAYMAMGINPMELTNFGGDVTTHMANATWLTPLKLLFYCPIMEELIFRLGLSFKRKTVALWLGLLPLVCTFYFSESSRVWYILSGLTIVGIVIYWLLCRFTADDQWAEWRRKYIIPSMWVSAIGFGLVHFVAFSVLNWQIFPFAFATILIPMAGGCVFTYLRVNLGFWWGVLFHCIFNIPSVLLMLATMLLPNVK